MICVGGCVCVCVDDFFLSQLGPQVFHTIFLAVCSGRVLFIIKTRQANENLRPTTIYKSTVVESYLYNNHANENLRPATIYN